MILTLNNLINYTPFFAFLIANTAVGPNIQLPGEGGVLGEKGVEQKEEGILVKPIPGFVLKTFLATPGKLDQGDREVILICFHFLAKIFNK